MEPVSYTHLDVYKRQGLDPAITTGAMVIANQNGYNYLDKLKDKDGKYILQPNPTQPTQMMLFGKYPIVKVSNRTVKSEPVYSPCLLYTSRCQRPRSHRLRASTTI